MLAVAALQLQCYSPLSSTARYSYQTHGISILLEPSLTLTDPENASCAYLNGLIYRAYAYVGTYTFVSDSGTYRHNYSLQLELVCADCTDFTLIGRASAVYFEMKFLEHMLEQSSAISQFLIEDFNKSDVFGNIVVKFGQNTYALEFTYHPYCHSYGKPAVLTFIYNSEVYFTESVSDLCTLSRLQANCGSECPAQLFKMLYDDFFRGSVEIKISYYMGAKTYYEETTTGTVTPTQYSPLFEIMVRYYVARLEPDDEVDCFADVGATFYSNALMLYKHPGAMTNCPYAIGVEAKIVVSEMKDYSGRVAVFYCSLTTATDEYVALDSTRELVEAVSTYMLNASVDISLFYNGADNILGLARYYGPLYYATYRNISVLVSSGRVCFTHNYLDESSVRKTVDLIFYEGPFLNQKTQIMQFSDSLLHPPTGESTCFYGEHTLDSRVNPWALLRITGELFPVDAIYYEVEFETNYYGALFFVCALGASVGISYALIRAINKDRFKAMLSAVPAQ